MFALFEIVNELLKVRQFAAEIHLPPQSALKLADERAGPIGLKLGNHFGQLRQARENVQIDGEFFFDVRMLDFDHHMLAGF